MSLPSPQALLRSRGLRPKKSFGQNFLGDPHHLGAIAQATRAGPDDVIVELGAGLGHLTERLLETGARVHAVERDRDLAPVLRDVLGGNERLTVHEADAARFDLRAIAQQAGRRILVVGNLPYHLGTEILFHVLDAREHVARVVFLLQREVCQRLAAMPDTDDYGVLSVRTQLWADVGIVHHVPAGVFVPPPEVESAVVRLELRDQPIADFGDEPRFRALVKAAFGQRRKTIRNALRGARLADDARLDAAFAAAGVDPGVRAEVLSVGTFCALCRALG